MVAGKSFFGHRELIHDREAKVVFFAGEIDFEKAARKLTGGFPANLAAKARFVSSALN